MRPWITVFALIVVLAAAQAYLHLPGVRQRGVFPIDPPTPYFHYLPQGLHQGNILVVHGLDANKEMMNLLCYALAQSGFDVYSMDLPGHGDSIVGFNAVLARQAVNTALDSLGPQTIAIGHSLGGALLLDIANNRPFKRLVLLSPAPTPIGHILAEHVLVLTGEFDLPRIVSFVPQLNGADAGSVELRVIPWAGHSGYLMQPEAIRQIVAWLGGPAPRLHTALRLGLLLCVISLALGIGVLWLPGGAVTAEGIHASTTVVSYVASAIAAMLISSVAVVLRGLQLYSTSFLISFVFVVGVTRLPSCYRRFSIRRSGIVVALIAAAFVVTVGVFAGSELVHLTLSDGRWWRFPAIAIAVLPLSFADEMLLRPIRPWWKAAALAALTRVLIAAFAISSVMTTNRNDAFLALIIHFIVLFWIVLWFAGELFRRHTQDPTATAIFTAIVQAWVFAAIFVTL